jgi:sucrose-6-phosphate hydrolase SacC (GH32 family)
MLVRWVVMAVLLSVVGIGWADEPEFPRELVSFEPTGAGPVFVAGGEGRWDVKIRERGFILREGPLWHMWFTGYDGTRPGLKMLGYASSRDGVRWTRHKSNPIYKAHWVEDMMVVKQGSVYFMFAEGRGDVAQLLVSSDGIGWTRRGPIDVRLTNGRTIPEGPYGTPTGYYENGTWYLFYERRDAGVWLATSTDMLIWTNVSDEAVLKPGPKLFDRDLVALNQVFRYKGRYFASYHGAARGEETPALWSSGLAVSDDLKSWTKYSGNPLRPRVENKSSGVFVRDGSRFVFYTMHGAVHRHLPISGK